MFHLLPKLHDGGGGVLQGHMAVVAHVQFLELHTILYSGNKTRNTRRLSSARAGSWKTFRADDATRWFYLTAPSKHASKNTEGKNKINNWQTVWERGLVWFKQKERFFGAGPFCLSHPHSTCPIKLFLPCSQISFPFYPLPCRRPVHGISLFCSGVPGKMRGTKGLGPSPGQQYSWDSVSLHVKRGLSHSCLINKYVMTGCNDVSLHVQRIPSFFIILSLTQSVQERIFWRSLLTSRNLMTKGDLNLR